MVWEKIIVNGVKDEKIIAEFFKRRDIFDTYLKKTSIQRFTCPSCGYPTLSERIRMKFVTYVIGKMTGKIIKTQIMFMGGPNKYRSLTESRLRIRKKFKD